MFSSVTASPLSTLSSSCCAWRLSMSTWRQVGVGAGAQDAEVVLVGRTLSRQQRAPGAPATALHLPATPPHPAAPHLVPDVCGVGGLELLLRLLQLSLLGGALRQRARVGGQRVWSCRVCLQGGGGAASAAHCAPILHTSGPQSEARPLTACTWPISSSISLSRLHAASGVVRR